MQLTLDRITRQVTRDADTVDASANYQYVEYL